jgi:hypothetical protein
MVTAAMLWFLGRIWDTRDEVSRVCEYLVRLSDPRLQLLVGKFCTLYLAVFVVTEIRIANINMQVAGFSGV